MLLLLAVAGAGLGIWSSSPRLDPRVFGEWTFLTTDGTGTRRFLAMGPNGRGRFEQTRPGSTIREPAMGSPISWWMEGDVIVFEEIWDAPTRLRMMAEDVVHFVRLRQRPDRSAFRLRIVRVTSETLRVAEASPGVTTAQEIEMTRVEPNAEP
ncbi:hypothetical protein Pan44_02300 [Caulifigura coniformis]|uniref:Lipocalin-like domain-containing protein n=2 Tax=Caulifigura coniformis TaxID=2527983 RepID=A0A517S7V7_9PLAN|nr:hypothetical protein Pan44_02300 [Caulifigura coniformis]